MNQATYQTLLTPKFQFHTPKSLSEGAEAMADAYHFSNIGQSTTPFAAPLMNANKDILKTFIEISLNINFYGGQVQSVVSTVIGLIRGAVKSVAAGETGSLSATKNQIDSTVNNLISSLPGPLAFIGPIISGLINSIFDTLIKTLTSSSDADINKAIKCTKKLEGIIDLFDVSKIAYMIMAIGYCLYWLTAKMSPVPPMPPCVGPTTGTLILIPGLPTPLNSDLGKTFTNGNSVIQAVGKLYNSLITHQLTIIGIYLGIIPFIPSPIPSPPIPWFTILNIPFPDIKLPSVLKDDEKKEREKSEVEKDMEGALLKAGNKLRKAKAGLKKQSKDLEKC